MRTDNESLLRSAQQTREHSLTGRPLSRVRWHLTANAARWISHWAIALVLLAIILLPFLVA